VVADAERPQFCFREPEARVHGAIVGCPGVILSAAWGPTWPPLKLRPS
jgi:hypothetical protein